MVYGTCAVRVQAGSYQDSDNGRISLLSLGLGVEGQAWARECNRQVGPTGRAVALPTGGLVGLNIHFAIPISLNCIL